jgi:hypothetical protein
MNKVFTWMHLYFIPHPGNDHKPHLFRDHTVLFLMAFIIGTEFVVLTASLLFQQTNYFLSAILPSALVNLTNDERIHSGIPTLTVNPLLARAAEAKAKDMAQKGYFAHTSPEGTTPWYWIIDAGYVFDRAGENLAVNFYGSEEVVTAWMNSPLHKKNILNEGFTEVGIGIAEGTYQGKNAIFVAQMFGKPTVTIARSPQTRTVVTVPQAPFRTPQKTTPAPVIAQGVPKNTFISTTSSPLRTAVLAESVGTENIPANPQSQSDRYNAFIERLFLYPDIYLSYAFIIAALFVSIPLLLSLFIELRRGHLRHILFGSALFATLFLLAWVNQSGVLSATLLA